MEIEPTKKALPSFKPDARKRLDRLGEAPVHRMAGAAVGTGFIVRMRRLAARDIAFIVAGLSILVMAPIAEHLISAPDEEGGTLRQGFDQKGPAFDLTPKPFEEGGGGMAPGGPLGLQNEVISPLNVRDPSSLIMAPGEAPRDAVASKPAPETKPSAPARDSGSGWKDALASAAKSGVKQATQKARLPMPGAKMSGALRGLSAASGGGSTGASLHLSAPSAPAGLSSGPRVESNLSRVAAAPGYRGVASHSVSGTSQGASPGSFDGVRRSGGSISGTGLSSGSEPTPTAGGSGSGQRGGAPSQDSPEKGTGNSSEKDSRQTSTTQEDLGYLARKRNMEKSIDLKWKKKEYKQYELPKMIDQTLLDTAKTSFTTVLDKLLTGATQKAGSSGNGGGSPAGGGSSVGGTGGSGTGASTTPRPQSLSEMGQTYGNSSAAIGQGSLYSSDPYMKNLSSAEKTLSQDFATQAQYSQSASQSISDAKTQMDSYQSSIDETDQKMKALRAKDDTLKSELGQAAQQLAAGQTASVPSAPQQDTTKQIDHTPHEQADARLGEAQESRSGMSQPDTSGYESAAAQASSRFPNADIKTTAAAMVSNGQSLYTGTTGMLDSAIDSGQSLNKGLYERAQAVNESLSNEQTRQQQLISLRGQVETLNQAMQSATTEAQKALLKTQASQLLSRINSLDAQSGARKQG